MVKKSSELEDNTENESTAIATTDDLSLETISDDDSLTDADANDADDGATAETEQLREQIVETRRGMGETIDAIQEKLSFSNISEQVKDQVSEQFGSVVDSVKDAAYGKANDLMKVVNKGMKEISKSDVVKTAAKYPWILSLVGLGVGALIVNSFAGGKKRSSDMSKYRYNADDRDDEIRYTDDYRRELKSSSRRREESTLEAARGKVGDAASSAYESVSGAAGAAYEGVSSAAGSAYESVGSAASKTYKGVGTAAGYAYDKAGDLGEQAMKNYDYYIEENPLVVGAVALAIGAAVGFAIPLTQKENEYLGEYRDAALEKAQATAQDAIGTVKQMAGEAQKAITDEVKSKTA